MTALILWSLMIQLMGKVPAQQLFLTIQCQLKVDFSSKVIGLFLLMIHDDTNKFVNLVVWIKLHQIIVLKYSGFHKSYTAVGWNKRQPKERRPWTEGGKRVKEREDMPAGRIMPRFFFRWFNFPVKVIFQADIFLFYFFLSIQK